MGTKLVRREGLTLALALLALAACKQEVRKTAAPAPTVPQVRATVITIETKIQPDNKTFTHTIVIAGDRARSLDETDRWRLFDLKANRVTFVDEIAKTVRTEEVKPATAQDTAPHITFESTNDSKALLGVPARRCVIRAGGYAHELWMGAHPAIPSQLFAMMLATERPLGDADRALLATRGFPLAEHAELPYLNKKLVVDKTVMNVESKNVPASLFEIPADFKAPAASPRSAS